MQVILPENCALFNRSELAEKSSDVFFCLCFGEHSDEELPVFFSVVVFAVALVVFRFRLGPHLRFHFTKDSFRLSSFLSVQK